MLLGSLQNIFCTGGYTMFKYFIYSLICIVLLLLVPKLFNKIEIRINQNFSWKTDVLIISFLIFVLADFGLLFYFVYHLIDLFLK